MQNIRSTSLVKALKASTSLNLRRFYQPLVQGTENCSEPVSRGLVLGIYSDEKSSTDPGLLTASAQRYNEVIFPNFFFVQSVKLFLDRSTQMADFRNC